MSEPSTPHPQAGPETAAPVVPAVQLPVVARGLAPAILAAIAVIFALQWAQAFIIPLLLGIIAAYTLNPPVAWLERIRIPRAVATLIVMLAVIGALAVVAYSLRGQFQRIVEQLPVVASKFSAGLARQQTGNPGTLEKMQSAATTMENATAKAAGGASAPKQAGTRVVVDRPPFKLSEFLLSYLKGAVGGLGQAIMVLFLTFFLLVGGDTFKRKLVRLSGPTLTMRKITVQILDDINDSIQKYLFMMLVTNVLVGLLTWAALAWIGLENAGAWAVTAGFLHVIPYLGPGVTAIAIGMAAFMQFDSFPMALLVIGASLVIATVVGTFITTWMTGRIAKHERRRGVHLAAVLGLALGDLGSAARHSDHRHRESRVAARGAAAAGGRVAG